MNQDLNELKLWQLLEIGLEDIKKQEPNVCMSIWVTQVGDVCRACLAGSVMVQRFGETEFQIVEPWMAALNYLRQGHIQFACAVMGVAHRGIRYKYVSSYHYDKERWYQDMEDLLTHLKVINL